jgi:hypothetical protein
LEVTTKEDTIQTFLPYADLEFERTARALDNQRLNKQALEGWQIMMTLLELDPQGNHRTPKGWVNHPAVKMWRGAELGLLEYINDMVVEWKRRGYRSTIFDKALATYESAEVMGRTHDNDKRPAFMYDDSTFEQVAESHRKALLVKNYGWYHQFEWLEDTGVEPTSYEYVWIG